MTPLPSISQKKINPCRIFFKGIWILYILFSVVVPVCYYQYDWCKDLLSSVFLPLVVGFLLGSIYFVVAGYTFYDLYLKKDGTSNRAGLEQVSMGKLVSWLMPALVMVIFVCLGFGITLNPNHCASENRGVYFTHSYHLGTIYKEAEKLDCKKLSDLTAIKTVIDYGRGLLYDSPTITHPADKNNDGTLTKEQTRQLALIHKIPFCIAFSFSFLGVLLFTLEDVLSRFQTRDLYPKTLIGYQVRFILAISLALVIAYYFMDDWPANSAPALFLLIGMFPRRALAFIEKKGRFFLNLEKEERKALPLTCLQGMTSYYYERFREINVTDVQNLANSDLLYLRKNMSCGSRLIADFVAQAILVIHFPEKLDELRLLGIRDIIAFRAAVQIKDSTLFTTLGRSRNELLTMVESDVLKDRIETLIEMKKNSDQREKDKMIRFAE